MVLTATFNYLQGSFIFPLFTVMLPILILVGGKENNPNFSLSGRLNISNHILMSFVFEILYYPSVTFHDCALWLLFLRKVLGWRSGEQAGSASLLTFCLIGTEKSLKEELPEL